jgi:GntR family transcriptional repressor for pyruvate dehydrogenase complex
MKTGPEFTSLQRQDRLSAQAADQIAHMILDQQLPIGARLPSERQLAEALGVSRTVVREAIRLLEARKLLEVQAGSGAVVLGVGPAPVTESITMLILQADGKISFDDLQAVRGVLEVATAGLAAQHATPADLEQMESALGQMSHAGVIEDQIQGDYDFHLAVARATQNQIFVLLLQALNDILIKSWNAYWEKHTALGPSDFVAADAHESDMYHYQILDAIRKHDADAARRAMSQMLTHWSRMYGEHDAA